MDLRVQRSAKAIGMGDRYRESAHSDPLWRKQTMSSTRRHDTQLFHAISIAFALAAALLLVLALSATQAGAASKKLPKITKVTPNASVFVGKTLSLQGKNFVKGKKKLIVIFKREGSKRRFTAQGTATSSTRATVVVPDVSGDLIRATPTTGVRPLDNLFRLRAITKYGAAKEWTPTSISPTIGEKSGATNPVVVLPPPDCDADGVIDGLDADDDNDFLDDATELSIGTDVCKKDTDGDVVTDFYEYTIAYKINGGPVLPYPKLMPYPNPIVSDGGDWDDDRMTTLQEFQAWQYAGGQLTPSQFYDDSDADSDNDGKYDAAEDVDRDLLPNHIEFFDMPDLNWLKPDTDGDGLCDGLDDQDRDGPPTPLAVADCTSPMPNNGPNAASDDPPLPPTATGAGDPDPTRIDGDDNRYSNFYEWYEEGADPDVATNGYDECVPSIYPVSPFCQTGRDWNPFPTE